MNAKLTKSCEPGILKASKEEGHRRFLQWAFCISMLLTTCCEAQSLAPDGCPVFHCTVEATGVTLQPLIAAVSTVTSNSSLGDLPKQGCSGNGTTLTCLFSTDNAIGIAQGTLKMLNATTLQPIWGSALADSYNLDAASSSDGQVPVNFANGTIAAGDSHYLVRYTSKGAVIRKLSLRGNDLNFGLTPISDTYGIVSQANGVLTLVNIPTWTNAGTLVLLDPVTNGSLQLVSPSSGAANVLYAVAQNKVNGNGFLFSVVINPATNKLEVSSVFTFTGQSGASPVVVTPSVSGLPNNLILLHVPGLIGDTQPKNRLLGLADSAPGLQQIWAIPLSAPLVVSPTVDQGSMSLFYHQNYSPIIYQNQLATGAEIRSFNLQTIAGIPGPFSLNAHLGATQYGSVFTLLVGGAYTSASGVDAEYVMAFQPIASPGTVLWSKQISSVPASYLAAWNFAPSSETGIVCPIAITDNTSANSAIVRLCDF
jgi:hypothetical protein